MPLNVWSYPPATGSVIGAVRIVMASGAESPLSPPTGPCRAVIEWTPFASGAVPFVVTVVVLDVAVAEPISVPSA